MISKLKRALCLIPFVQNNRKNECQDINIFTIITLIDDALSLGHICARFLIVKMFSI